MATAALVAAVLVLYSQTARFEFVALDDHVYVSENPRVQAGLRGETLRWAMSTYHTGNWHPLTWMSLMADASLFGPGPAGPHIVNMLLHAASSALLFVALRAMTGDLWPSALAAALFAVHPLRAESVAWVSERKDVLSGFFWMLTLVAYQWYARRPRAARYLLVAGVFALGLSAKAMLVTLPLVLLMADVWPLRRFEPGWLAQPRVRAGEGANGLNWPADAKRQTAPRIAVSFSRQSGARVVLEKVPLLALAGVASSFTVAAQRFGLALQDTETVPLSWRIVNAIDAYAVYLRKTVWPSHLAVFYPHPAFVRAGLSAADVGRAAAQATLLLVISAVILRQARRLPALGFGWLWYVGTLVPVVGLVQVGEQAYADRYTYIPGIGLAIIAAWATAAVVARRPGVRPAAVACWVAALIGLGTAAWRQVGTWRDSRTLFTQAVAVTDDNYFARSNLGNVLRTDGRLEEAAAEFERALAIRPDFAFALIGYGAVLERQNKLDDAAAQLERALRLSPTSARAHAHLGTIRYRQGRAAEALAALDNAVRIDPTFAYAQGNLGMVLLSLQRPAEAIPHLEQALRLLPDSAETYNNLGVAYFRLQRWADAVVAFDHALRLKPDYAHARTGLERAQRQLTPR